MNTKMDVLAVMEVPELPGNWPEDTGYENGDYECLCSQCGATFYGHKRRVVCRVCAKPAPVVDDALREAAEQRVSDYLHSISEGGEVRLDPYDPNTIAPIVAAALARAQWVQS